MIILYLSPGRVSLNQVRFEGCPPSRRLIIIYCTGFVQVIKGEGMPEFGRSTHGDLYIEYNVVLPTEISPQTRRSGCYFALPVRVLSLPYSLPHSVVTLFS